MLVIALFYKWAEWKAIDDADGGEARRKSRGLGAELPELLLEVELDLKISNHVNINAATNALCERFVACIAWDKDLVEADCTEAYEEIRIGVKTTPKLTLSPNTDEIA